MAASRRSRICTSCARRASSPWSTCVLQGSLGRRCPPRRKASRHRRSASTIAAVPVALAELDPDHVRRLRAAIEAATGPVCVHCGAGQRACALSLMALHPHPSEDLVTRAERLGLPVTEERLKEFVRLGSNPAGWDLLQAI